MCPPIRLRSWWRCVGGYRPMPSALEPAKDCLVTDMSRRPYILVAAIVCALALGASGCGGASHHAASKRPAQHTVLMPASLAFGAFHHFILLPSRAGQLALPVGPAIDRGVAAARFAASELTSAAREVQHNGQLEALFAPLQLTADKLKALSAALPVHPSPAQVDEINAILGRIAAIAKDNGRRIFDASAAKVAAAGGPRA